MEMLASLKKFLEPFYDAVNLLQGEQYVTLSSVYPSLNNLILLLNSFKVQQFTENTVHSSEKSPKSRGGGMCHQPDMPLMPRDRSIQ